MHGIVQTAGSIPRENADYRHLKTRKTSQKWCILARKIAKIGRMERIAAKYLISGRVQGVGFRYFAHRVALSIGVDGWVRNLSDGSVEVYASGTEEQLSNLEARLRKGPLAAQVRSFERTDARMLELEGFQIR